MLDFTPEPAPRALSHALELMRSALNVLDASRAPAEIGAHLDLAICRLEAVLDSSAPDAKQPLRHAK